MVAGISGALAVTLGSFGAHGLDHFLESSGADAELVTKRLDQFDTGVKYHLYHTLALLGLAALPVGTDRLRKVALGLFVAGIVFFSGSLYALVVTGITKFGAVAPIGGSCLIAAWVCLFLCGFKRA